MSKLTKPVETYRKGVNPHFGVPLGAVFDVGHDSKDFGSYVFLKSLKRMKAAIGSYYLCLDRTLPVM